MRCELAPSILSSDHSRFADTVVTLAQAGADRIHFDVMDGQFVPPITFGAQLVKDLRPQVETHFEAHLMTMTPEAHFDAFIEAGCKTVIFHAEAALHPHRLAQRLRETGVKAGIAINPGTPVEVLEPLGEVADLLLLMTVNPGWGGQKFISSCLDKVRRLRKFFPQIDIEVDGGIDPGTIKCAWDAGANVFVSGSFVTGSESVATALTRLRESCC